MPDDHSNADDSADLYGQDAYDDDATRNEMADESLAERNDGVVGRDEYEEDDGGSWWDEGLIGLLLVAGAILFFFPEPSTSAVGILLFGVGVVAWAIDALM